MDAARLQKKVYSGYGKAAKRIGYAFDLTRPVGAIAPLQTPPLSTVYASFTVKSHGFDFEKNYGYRDMLFNGLFDATGAQPGDYLVNEVHGTYFIGALPDIMPPLCVMCNHVLSVLRTSSALKPGENKYAGTTVARELAIMAAWPGSLLFDQRGRLQEVGLPMDLPSPYFTALLPFWPGVEIRSGDIVIDDNAPNRRYIVSSAEKGLLGWRLLTQQAVA